MAKTSAAPAMKKYFSLLRKDIQDLRGEMRDSYATKDDLYGAVKSLRTEMHDLQKQTIREFKVIAENIRKDGIDSHNDKISLHEDRIKRIEKRLSIPHGLSA